MASIDVITEINKLLTQQNALYASQAKMLKGQVAMTEKLAQVMSQINTSQAKDSINELNEAINQAGENLDQLGNSSQGSFSNVAKNAEAAARKAAGLEKGFIKSGRAATMFAKASAFFGTLSKDISFSVSAFTSLTGILGTVASSLFNVGAAIITIPFKMLNGMISNIGAGSTELAQALEDTRKQFGDLRTGASKAVLDMAKSMKGELSNTGLSTFRVFGNLAEKIQEMLKYGVTLGAMFNNLSRGMAANAEAVGAYVKGLGLTEDGMKGVGRRALLTGKTFADVGREITSFAYQMGESFGINGKEVSRAMGDMMQDVKNFGTLSVKELSQIAVFANKLGLSFQDLQGTIDAFDNFEDAAKGAAQLSQAFGLNLDVLDLINDQDPASRFDKLRKSFFATGKSVESMTRQELKLLAAQSGLTEEAVKLGFAQTNQGVSYEEIQKQAGITEKKQLSQAEAMDKLANSIERLVKQGEFGSGGFFDRFFQGFAKGITITSEYRTLMRSLRKDLQIVFRAGIQVGRAFVDAFPGVKEFFGGINDMFKPEKFKAMMSGVVNAFKSFFKDLTDKDGTALPKLFERLKKTFFDNFTPGNSGFTKIMDGFKTFMEAIRSIFLQMIPMIANGLKKGISFITEFIKDPQAAIDALKSGGDGIGSVIGDFIAPIIESLRAAWPGVQDELVKLAKTIWEKVDFVKIAKYVGLALFGPTAIKAIIGASISGIGTLATGLIGRFTGAVGTASQTSGVTRSIGNSLGGIFGDTKVAQQVVGQTEELKKASEGAAQAGGFKANFMKLAGAAAGLAVGGVAIAGALIAIKKILDAGGIDTLAKATLPLVVLGAAALAMVPMSLSLKLLGNISPGQLGKAALGVLAIAGVATLMALQVILMKKILDGVQLSEVEQMRDMIIAVGAMYLVAGTVLLGGALIGALAGSGAGAAAMALGVVAIAALANLMALNAYGLVKSLGKLDTEEIIKTVILMTAMANLYKDAAIVLLAAAAGGIAGIVGNMFGDGIGQIEAIIETMAKSALGIMKTLNKIELGAGFDEKLKAFIKIVESTSDFAETLGDVIGEIRPGFFESVFTSGNVFADNLKQSTEFITKLAEVIPTLIQTILKGLQSVSEEDVKKASGFATVVSSVSSLIKAVMPSNSIQVNPEQIWASLKAATTMFRHSTNIVDTLLTYVVNFVKSFSAIDIDEGKARNIGVILTPIVEIIKSMSEFGSNMTKVLSGGLLEGITGSSSRTAVINSAMDAMKGMMESVTSQITTMLPSVQGLVKGISDIYKDLSEEQIKKLSVGFEHLGKIFSFVSEMTKFMGTQGATALDPGAMQGFTSGILEGTMTGLADAAPILKDSISRFSHEFGDISTKDLTANLKKVDLVSRFATNAAAGISQLILAENQIGQQLASLTRDPIQLSTVLKGITDALHISSNEKFTIKSDKVNIEIKLEVKLDADEFETALKGRNGGSYISFNPTKQGGS